MILLQVQLVGVDNGEQADRFERMRKDTADAYIVLPPSAWYAVQKSKTYLYPLKLKRFS